LSRGGIEGTAGCSQASLWRAHVCEVDVFAILNWELYAKICKICPRLTLLQF
jgi:hypothetical protein